MVDYARTTWRVSIRPACRALPVERSTYPYRSRCRGETAASQCSGNCTCQQASADCLDDIGAARQLRGTRHSRCGVWYFQVRVATYGIPARLPLTESDPQEPISPYGYTKLVVERMLRDAEAACGIRHVALRYFNAAGADPFTSGELGELHEPETHLIPLVLFAAMRCQHSIKIVGNDYLQPMAPAFVTISTLATWLMRVWPPWNGLLPTTPAIRLTLGNGQGYSVAEVIKILVQIIPGGYHRTTATH